MCMLNITAEANISQLEMMIKTGWKTFSTYLIITAMFNMTACNIYNVRSIENQNTSCSHDQLCNTFQYYLENATKYFSSNAQFYFQQGSHHLYHDVVINNVHNFSMIGGNKQDNTGTQYSLIICSDSAGIIIINSSNILISNLKILYCGLNVAAYTKLSNIQMMWYEEAQAIATASILINNCFSTKIIQTFIDSNADSGLLGVNLRGESLIADLHSTGLELLYMEDTSVHTNTTVNILKIYLLYRYVHGMRYDIDYPIKVLISNYCSSVSINFNSTVFHVQQDKVVGLKLGGNGKSIVKFNACNFNGGQLLRIPYVAGIVTMEFPLEKVMTGSRYNAVWFTNCVFSDNHAENLGVILNAISFVSAYRSEVYVTNCTFNNNFNFIAMEVTSGYDTSFRWMQLVSLYIKNTSFHSFHCCMSILSLTQVATYIQGPVTFTHITRNVTGAITWLKCRSIIESVKSKINIHGYMEISNNEFAGTVFNLKDTYYLTLYENTVINITENRIVGYIFQVKDWDPSGDYPDCFFQYQTEQNNYNASKFNCSIIINGVSDTFTTAVKTVHCTWLDKSVFNTAMPYIVNSDIIQITSTEGQQVMLQETKMLCYCTNDTHYNCSIDELGPIFPGQTLSVKLAYHLSAHRIEEADKQNVSINYFPISVQSGNISIHECDVLQSREAIQRVETRQCSTVNFTILSSQDNVCELFLIAHEVFFAPNTYDAYFIWLRTCPVGFTLHQKQCKCDLVLTNSPLSIKSCDINQQTILRPANSRILGSSVSSMNDSHEYLVSAHCPFDYCIPHSSHLNLSSPHLQCQFNRTGLLCGKCHPSLSAVFGSSQCQHCSNIHLLIVIPLAVTGVLLTFLLFFLNLTITDGDIVPFIFYANIVSINSAIFFPQNASNNPSYVFISLANLDLGINVVCMMVWMNMQKCG